MKDSSSIGRLIVAGFGVLWTILAFSITADPPRPIAKIIFPGFGILFVIAALTVHTPENKNSDSGESPYRKSPVEQFEAKKTDSPGEANRKEPPVQAPAPQPRQKKLVFCPYCGTAQDEDYKICESCGAGRKNK